MEALLNLGDNMTVVAHGHRCRPATGTRLLLIGGLCGLAWAAGLRGLMSELAGTESTVSWSGTFVWVLLPGAVVGALLGWAEHLRRTGGRRGRRGRRWLALAPFAFTAVLFTAPTQIGELLEDGIGGGAIGFAVLGISGGYALSGNGRLWARVACGLVALAPMALWTIFATDAFGPAFALDTPRGAWIAVFVYSHLAVLMLACSIPHRPIVANGEGDHERLAMAVHDESDLR